MLENFKGFCFNGAPSIIIITGRAESLRKLAGLHSKADGIEKKERNEEKENENRSRKEEDFK